MLYLEDWISSRSITFPQINVLQKRKDAMTTTTIDLALFADSETVLDYRSFSFLSFKETSVKAQTRVRLSPKF